MTRLRALLLCAAMVALALAFPAQAAPQTCGVGGEYDNAGKDWLALRPFFSKGGEVVTAIATPVFRPDTVYATNGTLVVKTDNAGCDWETVYDVSEVLLGAIESPLPSRVVSLAAPSTATSSGYVYAAIERATLDGAPRPQVAVSADEGETWRLSEAGTETLPSLEGSEPRTTELPPVGRIRELAVCNLVPKAAYVVVDVSTANGAAATALYSTLDGGVTWDRRTETTGAFALGGIVVNPLVPSNVFAVGSAGLHQSENSGQTFDTIGPDSDAVSSLSAAVGASYVRLAIGHPGGNVAHVSDDGGVRWRAVPTPLLPRFVAVVPLRDALAVSDGRNLVVTLPNGPVIDATPAADTFGDLRFAAPTQAGVALMGIGDGKILRAVLDLATLRPIEQNGPPVRLLPYLRPNYFPPSMLPVTREVSLPAGGSKDVPFTLFLPRTPSPIDVMFLVDSTGSMQPVIDGLKASMAEIVNELTAAGLDVEFGVGDFRDVPAPHGKAAPSDMPYRRFRVIGPADEELQQAISEIRAAGGNGITSALIAAEQATAGKGYRAADGELIVDPGQDAKFREGTLRLAVIVTDIGMDQGGNYPRMSQTARLLREHGVRAVGIAVDRQAIQDEAELAERTGAITPEGGLDCDGNGTLDLAGGDPLVCSVPPGTAEASVGGIGVGPPVHLAPAIVAMTERAADFRRLGVTITGDQARASVAAAGLPPVINLKADNEVPFSVRFSCPVAPKPSRHEFEISAGPAGNPGGRSTAVLECAAAPVKPRPTRPPVEIIAPPVAAPVAAAAAPGPPPPNPVPNPNVNANPNPQPGLNANVGIADQRQEDFQLALVEADQKFLEQAQADQGITYAMSRRREADPALMLGPAALLVASATWAVRRRTAGRPAPQRARARRF